MDRFGLVLITAVITFIITVTVIFAASLIYLAQDDEVLVITGYGGSEHDSHITAIWMSKGYLKNRNDASRYDIPTKRVLVAFE